MSELLASWGGQGWASQEGAAMAWFLAVAKLILSEIVVSFEAKTNFGMDSLSGLDRLQSAGRKGQLPVRGSTCLRNRLLCALVPKSTQLTVNRIPCWPCLSKPSLALASAW